MAELTLGIGTMTTLTSFLADEHIQCDNHFASTENAVADADWPLAASEFQRFFTDMQRHFCHEEDVLFPAFEAHTGMRGGPTAVMRAEHGQMNEVFDAMRDTLARRDGNGYLGLSETLLMLMRQHNLKEENILYPMADQALEAQAEELLARMV
jgi:iron-sulfur cluster repair protein YtfE (RIC family)